MPLHRTLFRCAKLVSEYPLMPMRGFGMPMPRTEDIAYNQEYECAEVMDDESIPFKNRL